MADAGLVVDATPNKGGTWAGAVEQLDVFGRTIFVRDDGLRSEGLRALRARGAQPWPDAMDEAALDELLRGGSITAPPVERQQTLPAIDATEAKELPNTDGAVESLDDSTVREELFGAIRSLVTKVCVEPKTGQEIAGAWDVPKTLADRWVKRLVEEKALIKDTRPVRYTSRQRSLPGLST